MLVNSVNSVAARCFRSAGIARWHHAVILHMRPFAPLAFAYMQTPHHNKRACLPVRVSRRLHSSLNATGADSAAEVAKRQGLGQPKGYAAHKQYKLNRHTLSGLPPQISQGKPFVVLGIESSCDDTGVAVVRSDGSILSNVVYSQYEVHQRFGGIVPSLAMTAHSDNIDIAISEALSQAGLGSVAEVDAVAVTQGPGLEVCLRVGYRTAQALAQAHAKPFVTVHHLEAHCMIARLAGAVIVADDAAAVATASASASANTATGAVVEPAAPAGADAAAAALPHFTPRVQYPFLALLVSGGHTSLMVCRGLGDYRLLGGTLDDSLGESFDKAARLLGLHVGTSGGAAVEAAAASSQLAANAMRNRQQAQLVLSRLQLQKDSEQIPDRLHGAEKDAVREHRKGTVAESCALFRMKVPLRDKKNCDFSYSGLKNSFRMAVGRARLERGLCAAGTNAPSQQMQQVADNDVVALPADVAANLCYAFQDIAFAHVEDRVQKALDWLSQSRLSPPSPSSSTDGACTSLVVVGGVAANKQLRQRLLDLLAAHALSTSTGETPTRPLQLIFPPVRLCTDNGVMPAWTGVEKLLQGISDDPREPEVVARWPLGSMADIPV